jgi:hypothetical protein
MCPELVHTIDDRIAETSTDMSGIRKIHNQLAYNIEAFINGTKYIIDEITIRDFVHDIRTKIFTTLCTNYINT